MKLFQAATDSWGLLHPSENRTSAAASVAFSSKGLTF